MTVTKALAISVQSSLLVMAIVAIELRTKNMIADSAPMHKLSKQKVAITIYCQLFVVHLCAYNLQLLKFYTYYSHV